MAEPSRDQRQLERELASLRAENEAMRAREAQARAEAAQAHAVAEGLRTQMAGMKMRDDSAAATASPPLPAASSAAAAARTRRSNLSIVQRQLMSPSLCNSDAQGILGGLYCAVTDRPVAARSLGFEPPAPHVAAAFHGLLADADGSSRKMAPEANFYGRALSFLPSFAVPVEAPAGSMSAEALFTAGGLATRGWSFAGLSLPELHVRSNLTAARAFRPGFNGEVKSTSATWLEQAVYYTAMDMVRIFFPAAGAASPGERRFFARPPLGFALVAFPHVGYLVALEWVGKLFVSPASEPFFIGGAAHQAAVAALPDVEYPAPEALDLSLPWVTVAGEGAGAEGAEAVSWCVAGGRFRKVVRADARSAEGFRSLFEAYEQLRELQEAEARALLPPPLAQRVRLLFGAHELLVEMDCAPAGAREASDAEATRAGPVLERVAAGVAWLAARGLLYTDLRGPNVLIAPRASGGGGGGGAEAAAGEEPEIEIEVLLVDYDDCLVLGAPARSVADFRAALVSSGAAAAGPDCFAARYAGGACPDVEDALERAFGRLG